ncbi:MAG: hypothetical protein JSS34_04010 [Proteobacteria bacterium]|nr:hypothetical protein [Pseudomonadota bacterium]
MDICIAGKFFTQGNSSFNLKDKSDEKYLALAESAHADFFITGNLKHFPKEVYGCTQVYSPGAFLRDIIGL